MSQKVTEGSNSESAVSCPVCNKLFNKNVVEEHVNKCLFLNTSDQNVSKRNSSHLHNSSPSEKRMKAEVSPASRKEFTAPESSSNVKINQPRAMPLAEQMRPLDLMDIVGQENSFGPGSMLRSLLEQNKITNMILWGPPGCGKTSVANVVANICKKQNNMRYVKLSAAMSGIGDVKEIVKVAKNEGQFKRQTVLFMDEIHRFNKLQQDTFLPHVENGTIILIGATTENPSFSLNNALLSRCRVVVMEKLTVPDVLTILKRALHKNPDVAIAGTSDSPSSGPTDHLPKCLIEGASLSWLAAVCDGDARVALGALELALEAAPARDLCAAGPHVITLEDVKDGIKRSHVVYDRAGEEHYNTVSALHKAVRAGADSAALYWLARALQAGEDPLYVARRLVRMAAEDIGLADPSALVEAVACLQGCQHIGMPECDVVLAQCVVRLARAPKSRAVDAALARCRRLLAAPRAQPPVPLHLRNAPTKLMKEMGYGSGYNMSHKDESGLSYMPDGMEDYNFFENGEDEAE